jgi:hypothetical protein
MIILWATGGQCHGEIGLAGVSMSFEDLVVADAIGFFS